MHFLSSICSLIKKEYERRKELLTVFAAIVFIYTVFYFTGIGCPIKYVTGISCAGCGMSRAWVNVLRLDFARAYYFHPLFWVPPLVVILYMLKGKMPPWVYNGFLFTFAAIFVIVYIYRIVLNSGDIVVFKPRDGLICRLLFSLRRRADVLFKLWFTN